MKKFWSSSEKGIGQVFLLILLPTITIAGVMIFYLAAQQGVQAEVKVEAGASIDRFNSMEALRNTIRGGNQEIFIQYNEGEETAQEVENVMEDSLSYIGEDIGGGYTTGYRAVLSNPEQEVEINESDGEEILYKSTTNIASPDKEAVLLEVYSGVH